MSIPVDNKPAAATSARGPEPAVAGKFAQAQAVQIHVEGVSKAYGGRPAVQNVTLQIAKGSIVSILGPSGCGKTTLLRMIAGLAKPTAGSIEISGKPVSRPPWEAIYIFQQYNKSIFPWRTVTENVAFGLRYRTTLSKKEIAGRCREYLELMGLGQYGDYFPAQLSGGMQQRVAIARALVCEPEVLLMDEPFSAVDALTRNGLQDLLLQLWERIGITIVLVTHDIEEAIYLSQRVIVMSPAPAGVVEDSRVPLPYPRHQIDTREAPQYLPLRHRFYSMLTARGNGESP